MEIPIRDVKILFSFVEGTYATAVNFQQENLPHARTPYYS